MSPQAVEKQDPLYIPGPTTVPGRTMNTGRSSKVWLTRWHRLPSTKHQIVAGNLFSSLIRGLAGKPCRPFIAPTDVKLSDLDIVQPDILVVCDSIRITPTHIAGAPDVVIEVLSPATAAKDLRQKKRDLFSYPRRGIGGLPWNVRTSEEKRLADCLPRVER